MHWLVYYCTVYITNFHAKNQGRFNLVCVAMSNTCRTLGHFDMYWTLATNVLDMHRTLV